MATLTPVLDFGPLSRARVRSSRCLCSTTMLYNSRESHTQPVISKATIAVTTKDQKFWPWSFSCFRFMPNTEVARLIGT